MTRMIASLAATVALFATAPAFAQGMQGMDMGGMKMPAPAKKPVAKPKPQAKKAPTAKSAAARANQAKPAAKRAKPATRTPSLPTQTPPSTPMAGMDHGSMDGMEHGAMPGMDMSGDTKPMKGMDMFSAEHTMPDTAPTGTALPAGNAPAPTPPTDHYAARLFPAAEIDRSHRQMMNENGAQTLGFVVFNLAEYQPRRGRDAFRWDGEAWYGGDINRLTLKTEGEGRFGESVEAAEVQALYSRAIGPYFNAQAGVRQDLGRGPRRTYATVGLEGLAPYWFEVEGALFLSDKGDLLGRLEGYYDQRITQRLVLQPRVELNLAAQDMPANGIGAGLSTAELGLRLRYEIKRQFAPYVGMSWERKVGATARFARAAGEDVRSSGIVMGVRFWF